jgi:flagellar motility protein MotE (MotC chaperone)
MIKILTHCRQSIGVVACLIYGLYLVLGLAAAQTTDKPPRSPTAVGPQHKPTADLSGSCEDEMPAEPLTPAHFEPYCKAVYEELGKKRQNREAIELKKVIEEVEAKTATLEQRIETLKEWTAKRDAFKALAQESIVKLYSRMQPESAASQLVAMPEDVAAAVVMKLDAKLSGVILAEMDAAKAARITSLIAVAGEVSTASKTAPSKAAAPKATK